jgi:hypothetical protein
MIVGLLRRIAPRMTHDPVADSEGFDFGELDTEFFGLFMSLVPLSPSTSLVPAMLSQRNSAIQGYLSWGVIFRH